MNYASMLKSNSIRLAILVELRLVTDRQTDRHPVGSAVFARLTDIPNTQTDKQTTELRQSCVPIGQGGNVTSTGWQVTLCDPMWHVSSRSGVATLRTAIHLLLLLTYMYAIHAMRPIQIGLTSISCRQLTRATESCCRHSLTICAINCSGRASELAGIVNLVDRRLPSLSRCEHPPFSGSIDNTLRRSICCGEIFYVQSLEQSSRRKYLYF